MPEITCRVSVVVPTFKRTALLIRCLTALMAQDFDATAYEVIIADDAASEETRQAVEALAGTKDLAGTSRTGVINHAPIRTNLRMDEF